MSTMNTRRLKCSTQEPSRQVFVVCASMQMLMALHLVLVTCNLAYKLQCVQKYNMCNLQYVQHVLHAQLNSVQLNSVQLNSVQVSTCTTLHCLQHCIAYELLCVQLALCTNQMAPCAALRRLQCCTVYQFAQCTQSVLCETLHCT